MVVYEYEPHSQVDVGCQWIPDPLTRDDERPKGSYGCALTAPSKRENLSVIANRGRLNAPGRSEGS